MVALDTFPLRSKNASEPQRYAALLEGVAAQLGLTHDELYFEIAVETIGRHLDEHGLPEFVEPGEGVNVIFGDAVAQSFFERRSDRSSSEEDVLAYMAAKIYWGWRHGMREVEFWGSDARRLGITGAVAFGSAGRFLSRPTSTVHLCAPGAALSATVPIRL